MEKNQQILGTESVAKLLLKYSVPAIIGMMVNGLYNVVDRIFIGNIPGVGPLAITGLGVTMPIMTIILAFGMLIGIGAATNISIKLGENKKEEAEKIIGNSISLSIIIGLILTFIGLVFGDSMLAMFGASKGSMPYAKAYIDIIIIGNVFSILGIVFNNIIRGDGNPKLSAIIMVVGCILNIVLDALFINVFKLGIQGAALATVTSQIFTAVWGLMYYTKGKSNLKYEKANLKLDKEMIKIIVAIGSAPFAMQIAASCVQIICNNSLKTYGGDLAIGAMATISSIVMMVGMPIFGISQGAQPIIGYNYGSKQFDRVEKTLKMCMVSAVFGLTLGWIVIQVFPEALVKMFNDDKELVAMSVDGMRKYLSMMPVIGVSMIGTNYIQSIGKAKEAMMLSLLRQVILLVPMMLFLPKVFGLDGIWFAQPIADIISCIVTGVVVYKEIKSHKVSCEEIQYE